MSWTRYLLHDFWTARELNRLDDEQRRLNDARRRRERQDRVAQQALEQRVAELEQGLDEAALLLRTIADLCIEKGVLTAADVAARSEQLDALDGVIDGRMGEPRTE